MRPSMGMGSSKKVSTSSILTSPRPPRAGLHDTHLADEESEAQGSEGGPTGVQEDQR